MVVGRRKGREDRDTLMTYIRNVTRRDTLALGAGALAASLAAPASAEEEPERHGMSSFGELKYPANFKHFDYINVNAPKGGIFSQVGSNRVFNQNFLTLNSSHNFIPQAHSRPATQPT